MNFALSEGSIRALVKAHGGSVEPSTVRALLPAAMVRDLLWCLCQIEAMRLTKGGLTKGLESYTRLCCRRLDIEYEPR